MNDPQNNDSSYDETRDDSCKKDLLRVVAGSVFIDLFGFIPHFFLCSGTKRRHHLKRTNTRIDHVEDEGDLAKKNHYTFHYLLMTDKADSHYDG